jgi:hypothetical protein
MENDFKRVDGGLKSTGEEIHLLPLRDTMGGFNSILANRWKGELNPLARVTDARLKTHPRFSRSIRRFSSP